jgi:NAD(P)-dependent dehydrogenase (short-subunit alcohol dehydrogenase family)
LLYETSVRGMLERHWGCIMNIASDTVWRGVPMVVRFITSQAGLIGFIPSLATEVGEWG